MPSSKPIPLKRLPFLRLLIALCAGIVTEWYCKLSLSVIVTIICSGFLLLFVFSVLPASKKFIFRWLQGAIWLTIFCAVGMLLVFNQNITNSKNWYANYYKPGNMLLLTIQEPLVEKANSYKALATVTAINNNTKWIAVKGKVLLYFKKDSIKPVLKYGAQIVVGKQLQLIQNSGNPAAFNYNRYCLFQGITGQVFLSDKDYRILSSQHKNFLTGFLFAVRDKALQTLRTSIHSPNELGIAEALLIGYRNDLDRDLVQAYSNTGVVHIIAISGLHIAMIYAGLLRFFSLFKSSRLKKWLEPVTVLLIIWLFTLIAGAAPSVLRAAIMFTFILSAKFIGRNTNIYNTLAASAFVILVINPFYLWDVGFQLSYTAVFGIVLFFRPVRNLVYFSNKSLRWVWDLSAVSLCAQVFTLPLVIYHFHQLPLLFLISNLVVVPLSGLVLMAELVLFLFSWSAFITAFTGRITEALIWLMNVFVGHIDKLPFSVWEGLQISIIQLIVLLIAIAFVTLWLFTKNTKNVIKALVCMVVFFVLRDVDLLKHKGQEKLIVYNVPKQTAIDLIAGKQCYFAGDSMVLKDAFLKNFNIKPARIQNRIYSNDDVMLPDISGYAISFNYLKIVMPGEQKFSSKPSKKIKVDVLILSGNTSLSPAQIAQFFDCNYIVADGSVPYWKSSKWKKEFEQLHLRFVSVAQQGAFVLKLKV